MGRTKAVGQNLGKFEALRNVVELDAEDPESLGPLGVLVIGAPGSGKTWSLKSLAFLEGEKIVLDFDRGSRCLSDPRLSGLGFKRVRFGDSLADPVVYPAAEHYLDQLMEDALSHKRLIAAICCDSLTNLGRAAMNDILESTGRMGSVPNQDDFNIQMNHIQNFLLKVAAFPSAAINILTCHVKRDKDDETGRWINQILTTGSLRDMIPGFFQEVYFAYRAGEGAESKYLWQTAASKYQIARTQLGLEDPIEQDYERLLEIHRTYYNQPQKEEVNAAREE